MKNPIRLSKDASNLKGNMMKKRNGLLRHLLAMILLLTLASCLTPDERGQVLTMEITEKNDSLLTYDTLIITVHSKDGTFSQEVFHAKLRDPKQVASLPLDPRVGEDYTVTIVGFKNGKMGVNKEVTFIGSGYQSKDLPIKPDTVVIIPELPEIVVPSDTFIAEGDSLRLRLSVRNGWTGKTTLTLKDANLGASLDTAGRGPGDGYFTWRPTFDQGRSEPYGVTFIYATADKKVEKIVRIKVLNVNRPPRLATIPDQKVKENETLAFKVEGSDPDHDSLRLTALDLPTGAIFTTGNFTWKPSEGQAGNYSITFRAFDNADSDWVTVLITVGNVEPPPAVTVKITSPSQDTIVNITPITVFYSVNGTALQRKVDLKDGKTRVRIDTTILGRSGFDTVIVTLDTIPPSAPIVSASSPVRTRTPAWAWIGGGNGSGLYRYRLDSDDMSGSTTVTTTAYTASKDLDVGTHTLYVQERDAAGNWSASGRRAVRIDTTKPAAPTVTVSPTSPSNNPIPTWSWSSLGDDLNGLYRYKLDTNDFRAGGTETETTHFAPEKALKEGIHTLYVQQQDSAGNWSNAGSASINVDLAPPGKPVFTPTQSSPTNNSRPAWNVSSGGGAAFFRLKLDDTNFTQGAKAGSFVSFTPDSALSNGPHILYGQERDSAGNWSGIQSSTIIVDLVPPTAPVFDPTPSSPLNSLQPSWTWRSGGGGIGTYRFKLDYSIFTKGADTIKSALFKPAMALSEGLHFLYLQERDSAGNWSGTSSRALVLSTRKALGGIGITPDAAYELKLAFSKDGTTPYLGFRDAANGDKATVMRFNGTSWEILGKAGFTSGKAFTPSLAISNSGIPYVAYVDIENGEKITVMSFNGGSWEVVGTSGISLGRAYAPSLALTKEGVPYVVYRDLANGRRATALRFLGGHWEQVGTAGFTSLGVSFISLAFSNDGTPHVAFCKDSLGNQAILMRFNGTSWVDFGSNPISAGSAYSTSLVFSSSDIPYVSFADVTNSTKAVVRQYTSSGWENVGISGFTPGAAFTLALALSKDDKPFVAFGDGVNGTRAKAMAFTGNVWETVGTAEGLSTGGAYSTAIAVSNLGVPYVAFLDDANGDKATVVKTSFDP
jgi:hypothetical protein